MRLGQRGVRRPRLGAGMLAILLALGVAAAGCDGSEPRSDPKPPVSSKPPKVTKLTFGVWGPQEEVAAYQDLVETYNADSDGTDIELLTWPSHEAFNRDLRSEDPEKVPDVYLASRGDLALLRAGGLNQPLLELLDERGVDYSDDYARDALLAFSADNELQCMPYGASPMVMYYNTDLIDFERMRQQELPAPADDSHEGWTFEEFTAAANFATRPRRGSRGVYVDPTLRGLAPFIYSGGGKLFDDDDDPTSLALADDDSREALSITLELLRDASVTLTDEQLARATPLEWFKRGKLGMIPGFRALTPELRRVSGLSFDVMPMPRIDDEATVGELTGLCLSSDAANTAKAADFLVYVVSRDATARVAAEGYLAPANLPVAVSDDFLQPGRMPEHAAVFTESVDRMVVPPLLDDWPQLERAVSSTLRLLLTTTLPDLDALTTQIDEESRAVLDPEQASESPSPTDE
ncbi:ABC transporter substrate-binding protein [Nocardioides sp. cx-173]|uniref:ABC transporter substrate-binding protein n=1 Tax=Nocardioides sp. cx-173 TaxID=2898796 RepID=UPI001E443808|nr:extracellular solute-binding protein [Nocardioides sp. cx-173]MCD4526724.1 extracellular solute-binding protein [Nocardioides sp. cx-173]UGB42534.1 extracellular solute-binding protein [Nocardioides sp. cx-173]